MNNLFSKIFESVKIKKGYFILLIFLTIISIVLGVIAAMNFGSGIFTIDLSNISYIKFLKGDTGFMSLIFSMILSLSIFFFAVLICNWKTFLLPLGIVFYLYLVYSQTVIITSVILIYGILNCIILVLLLLVYSVLVWCLFLVLMTELGCVVNENGYFKTCFSVKRSKVLWFLILLSLLTFAFVVVLVVLKNFVVLLIF